MPYTPKSQVNIKETNGKDFYIKGTKTPYVGNYMELSNGKFFSGTDSTKPGPEIVSITPDPTFQNRNQRVYSVLKPLVATTLQKYKFPVSAKNVPTEKDYQTGYFFRYFLKRNNSNNSYKEINKKTYDSVQEGKSEYDTTLYSVGRIKWALKGNVRKINTNLIIIAENKFPNLSTLYPQITEYERKEIVNDQIANPGELFYRNEPNREYIGSYHIHPDKGPMVGARHQEQPHESLVFAEDRDNLQTSTSRNNPGKLSNSTIPKNIRPENFNEEKTTLGPSGRSSAGRTTQNISNRPTRNQSSSNRGSTSSGRSTSPSRGRTSSGGGRTSSGGRGGY